MLFKNGHVSENKGEHLQDERKIIKVTAGVSVKGLRIAARSQDQLL